MHSPHTYACAQVSFSFSFFRATLHFGSDVPLVSGRGMGFRGESPPSNGRLILSTAVAAGTL